MQYEDRIDDYLLGRMSSEEEQNFLKDCGLYPRLIEANKSKKLHPGLPTPRRGGAGGGVKKH